MLAKARRNIYSRVRLKLGHQLADSEFSLKLARRVCEELRAARLERLGMKIRHPTEHVPFFLIKLRRKVLKCPSQKREETNLVHL